MTIIKPPAPKTMKEYRQQMLEYFVYDTDRLFMGQTRCQLRSQKVVGLVPAGKWIDLSHVEFFVREVVWNVQPGINFHKTRALAAVTMYLDKVEVTTFGDAGAGRRRYLLGSRQIVEQETHRHQTLGG